MSKVSATMNVASRAMMNAQTGLQTVSHNIANKNTDGYSRQRVEFQSTPPTTMGDYQIGTGAKTSAVARVNNPHLEKQIQFEQSKLGFGEGKVSHLNQVEAVFNEQIHKGLNNHLGEFFNSFRELSNNPESLPIRTLVKETALQLTQDFKRINNQLKEVQRQIDSEIKMEVEEVNRMTAEIADLNQKVENIEITGAQANDHRDRRDHLIKALGEKINIRYAEVDRGKVNITAGNSIALVSGYDASILSTSPTPKREGKREGNIDVFVKTAKHTDEFKVTEQIKGGKLGGALEIRDQTINELLGKVDNLAFTLADKVNEIHRTGFDQKSRPATNFFNMNQDVFDYSDQIKVNEMILKDVSYISSGLIPDAPGDNRIANVIASLQYKPFMANGSDTAEQFYNSMVGELAVLVRKTSSLAEHQKDSLDQLKNIRESISGVSLDEETVKMIEFQKAFDASAKLIRTADEMLDTVINLKR